MVTVDHARPVEASEVIKAYRQEPAETDMPGLATSVASTRLCNNTDSTAAVPRTPAAKMDMDMSATGLADETHFTEAANFSNVSAAPAGQTAQAFDGSNIAGESPVLDTVPLSEVPVAVQEMLASDAAAASQSESAAVHEASHPILTAADIADVRSYQSNDGAHASLSKQAADSNQTDNTASEVHDYSAASVLQTDNAASDSRREEQAIPHGKLMCTLRQ